MNPLQRLDLAINRFAAPLLVIALTCALICVSCSVRAQPRATVEQATALPEDDIRQAVRAGTDYVVDVLIDSQGITRGEYDLFSGTWRSYEPAWHTGQLIYALLAAESLANHPQTLPTAQRAADWWANLAYTEPGPLQGFLRAEHGAEVGSLINFTTIADGTPGLFELSRRTGNPRYADVATSAGDWAMRKLWLPEQGVMYDLIDSETGHVLTERDPSPHFPADQQLELFDVTRPNNEGFLYLDMFRHTGDSTYLEVFRNLSDALVRYQDTATGIWLDFHPNNRARNKVHPRSNTWYAESLLRAYEQFGDERYRDAALRLARAMAGRLSEGGVVYYDQRVTGAPDRRSLSGSATAFAALLWVELLGQGYTEFEEPIQRAGQWLLANQFPANHPDPNVRGAFLETWRRADGPREHLYVRDIATSFSLRFFAAYHAHYYGLDAPSGKG